MAKERSSGWSRRLAAVFALIIILGGVTVSVGFGVRLRAALERNAVNRLAASAAAVQTTVENELGRYSDAVRLGAAAISSLPEPTASAFRRIAASIDAQELTAVRAMSLVVPGSDGLTARWRSRGAQDFTPQPAKGVRDHLYPVLTAGLGGKPAPPVGVDQGPAQALVDATRAARTGKTVAISDAYVRLADADLPAAQRQLSFDVVAPVIGTSGKVNGYAVLNVAAADLVSTGLALAAAGNDLDVQLLTRAGTGALTEVASVVRNSDAAFRHTANFTTGERQWVLRSGATYQALLPNAGRTDMVVVVAGATLATMFGILLYLQMSATARADQEVAEEVAERVAELESGTATGRLREALAAREALLGGLLSPPGELPEVDLPALVAEAAATVPAVSVTLGDLPPAVRAQPAVLRQLLGLLFASAAAAPTAEPAPNAPGSAPTDEPAPSAPGSAPTDDFPPNGPGDAPAGDITQVSVSVVEEDGVGRLVVESAGRTSVLPLALATLAPTPGPVR